MFIRVMTTFAAIDKVAGGRKASIHTHLLGYCMVTTVAKLSL